MTGTMTVAMKDTITHKSDKEMIVDVQVQGPDGKWMPVTNMPCKKG